MNYIRGISGPVSKTWNSINPSILSGAIDVIVIEHEDGSLACSPFHVRFGMFSLLRPYEKKVEFRVNDVKQDYAMKLAEGGEAFFVFETSDNIPEAMQTSPLIFSLVDGHSDDYTKRSHCPPPLPTREAIEPAVALSNRLSVANIPSQVTDTGDLILDMAGYKSSEDDALRAEVCKKSFVGRVGSEEAKEAANQRAALVGINDAASDTGNHSAAESDIRTPMVTAHHRPAYDASTLNGLETLPETPPESVGDPNRNYAKTLRLTSNQLKAIGLKSGPNPMAFTMNRATC
ncbi:lipin, N-terminal conserved region-domain-containing protein [Truncatella angustata]|uniref:Lipin, N-terminal conserved region-domain-containing protein n=1 Tax=Truncatella angustata TaxID=152316 RepID=A0A9P8UFI4_9PEZI|nr:lipin, N-terminal conserved region-domain-containing protein [Truncatella angustata]KAH6649063.1 lipin, N-terminal conserved region-domain-containing protein [Truncatella angustata]